MSDTINIDFLVHQTFNTSIEIGVVVDSINELPLVQRWNFLAKLLNKLHPELDELTDSQKELIKTWLEKQLAFFNPTPTP